MWEEVEMWEECHASGPSGRSARPLPHGVPFPTIWVHRKGKIGAGDGVGKVHAIRGVVDVWLLMATYIQLPNLDAVSSPGTREISALTYRSPEVHFGKSWDHSTDIWSWGIILAQLLLTQVDFRSPGMYASIAVWSLEGKTKVARDAMAIDFDLHSLPLCTDDAKSQAMLPPARPEMAYKWAEAMMAKGISRDDIQFLANTLNPLPGGRFTTVEILESGYLDI